MKKLLIWAATWTIGPIIVAAGAIVDGWWNTVELLKAARDLAFDLWIIVMISIPPALLIWLMIWLCGKY